MMGYYDNLPSFKPQVDPRSFGGSRMNPDDRATMNMRMDSAIPDAPSPQPKMPMQPMYIGTGVGPGDPMKTRAITPSFPVLNSRDAPPALPAVQPTNYYGQPPAIMQPVDTTPSAASRYAGDVASKTFLPYVQSAITNAGQGNYLRSVGNVAGALKQAVVDAPSTVASDIGSAISGGYNEFKQGAGIGSNTPFKTAFSSYVTPKNATSAPAAATSAPAQTQGGPKTVSPAAPQQRLSELYPSYFKSPPKFADALNGGGGSNPYKLPLTAAEQNYNYQIQRSMELENRARELSNVDRYRATQLHDRHALAALEATRGGPGESNHGFAREEYDPRYIHYPKDSNTAEDKADMIAQREKAVQEALFDPTPGIPDDIKLANVRRRYPDLVSAYLSTGKQSPYENPEDYIAKLTGTVWNGKYFVQPK